MIRIGLGLSVCDKCGSVVYTPATTTTTTAAAPETTLYLTDTAAPESFGGFDMSKTHDSMTMVTDGNGAAYFMANTPIASATWGTWGGELKIKIINNGSSLDGVSLLLNRVSQNYGEICILDIGPTPAASGQYTINIPVTNWDLQGASADDILILVTGVTGGSESYTIDCTNPTDTYLTLDAELDPQPWPA